MKYVVPDPASVSDLESSVEAIRSGDRAATDAFVRAIYPRLFAAALKLLGHEHDAQDAVQDALLRAITHLDQFRGQARLSTWALRILINTALMKRRSQRHDRSAPLDPLLPRFAGDGHRANAWPHPENEMLADLDAEVRRATVRRCVDQLPDAYRTVLILRDMQGLDTADAAAALGVSAGAVKVRLHRARMALRQLLEDQTHGLPAPVAAREGRPA